MTMTAIYITFISIIIVIIAGAFTLVQYLHEPPKHGKERWKKRNLGYQPPETAANGPQEHIRTHNIGKFYAEIGRPTEVGALVTVNMSSGKKAIYKVVNIERAVGVDWNWLDLEFVRYES
jgi:hypothetical protein